MNRPAVLVVEDSPAMAERILSFLPADCFNVVGTAATEDQALELLEIHAIDIAIVDLQLHQGTGFGVLRRLDQMKSPAMSIVFTNHSAMSLKVACFEAGADHFLDKSQDLARLVQLVGDVAFSRRARA